MLTWFPSPYPDELFYSVLCRYYLSSGIKEHYLVKKQLFGTKAGVKMATLGLYYYPVYRYTYRGETYEQIGNVPAMEEQARKKVGTELTLFIDPAKPTSFYCLEEEKGYFQQRLAYLIVALLVIAVLIMIGVMWLTI